MFQDREMGLYGNTGPTSEEDSDSDPKTITDDDMDEGDDDQGDDDH